MYTMILYAQSWSFNIIGGGFRESKRAMQLSELLGVNISPSQVQLWQCLRFFFKCYFSLPFFNFHLYEFSWQWVISHDMNLLLILFCNCFSPSSFSVQFWCRYCRVILLLNSWWIGMRLDQVRSMVTNWLSMHIRDVE